MQLNLPAISVSDHSK